MVIILHKGAVFKKIQNILQQFYSYFKGIKAIKSNFHNSKSLDFTSSSMYERRVNDSEPLINKCIGEEVLRNYHYT